MKRDTQKAKKHVARIRQLMSKTRAPFRSKDKQAIIDGIRKTRARLWEEKLAAHS